MNQAEKNPGGEKLLEIYIHIPFCVKKCDYCDFLSGPSCLKEREAYVKALCEEMTAAAAEVKKRTVTTVFIGGGTPSVLEENLMEQILCTLNREYTLAEDVEFTIESNPGTLNMEKLKLYRKYGINRLSLGLQSVFDDDLKMLGRIHSFYDFETSFRMAREAGFWNINVDLMSAIPGQSEERWRENLRRVAEFEPEHISAYSLIIEEGTPFSERELDLPDEDTEYRMYEDTARILQEYGYQQYEISNYARKGLSCRHNIGYWKREEYLGLGLGASSFVHGMRFSNTTDRDWYQKNAHNLSVIREDIQILSKKEEMEEFMFLGLRMTEGISEKEFEQLFDEKLENIYGEVLWRYEKTGHLQKEKEMWKFSREGIHVSNWILADFLQDQDEQE